MSPLYSKSLMGIAVDEVHCVTQWGQSNSNQERWHSGNSMLDLAS